MSVTLSFGGKDWSISPADFQLAQVSSSQCLGAFFEFSSSSTAPSWIVGDTFLVRILIPLLSLSSLIFFLRAEKCLLSIPRVPCFDRVCRALRDRRRDERRHGYCTLAYDWLCFSERHGLWAVCERSAVDCDGARSTDGGVVVGADKRSGGCARLVICLGRRLVIWRLKRSERRILGWCERYTKQSNPSHQSN